MHKPQGFTLIEVLIVLLIVSSISIVLSSSNAFTFFATENSLLKAQENLRLSLLRARQLAVKSQTEVNVCGGVSCGGDWSQGISVQMQNETLSFYPFPDDIKVIWKGFPVHKSFISFLSNGLSSYQNGTFYLCDTTSYSYIRLNQSGRFYSSSTINVKAENSEAPLC